jgi:hypothetical protein
MMGVDTLAEMPYTLLYVQFCSTVNYAISMCLSVDAIKKVHALFKNKSH